MFNFKKFPVIVVAASIATIAAPAFASGGSSGVDVSAVVSAINAASTPIASIGAAVLIVMVGTKVYKWIRRAM
ncbi:major capsid protein [Xanthomonas albilineans]|uniref:Phage-related protein n=1 Tax=Xanthomonas albilineans (strain GPE PC73 / CFBP 7063) TaxID=380358 RepID=D2UDQ2_XANAP|nr:major capsid protein [Xanthomonas albilineans]PPU91433.1 methyltransferase [Xanthomonas albilineans]CBA16044.1 hypothetical protein XALC_1541 [Xanthomonas albilineans GPE PC73]